LKLKDESEPAPWCGATMEFNWETTELPYFGDALIIGGYASAASGTAIRCF
jgi:hypothetical protein